MVLRRLASRKYLTSTEALAKVCNEAEDPDEPRALSDWLETYITWFENSGRDVHLELVLEYA